MEGLRGDGPCVTVTLHVRPDVRSGESAVEASEDTGGASSPSNALPPASHAIGSIGAAHVPGSGLLCKLGLCKCGGDWHAQCRSRSHSGNAPMHVRLL